MKILAWNVFYVASTAIEVNEELVAGGRWISQSLTSDEHCASGRRTMVGKWRFLYHNFELKKSSLEWVWHECSKIAILDGLRFPMSSEKTLQADIFTFVSDKIFFSCFHYKFSNRYDNFCMLKFHIFETLYSKMLHTFVQQSAIRVPGISFCRKNPR